MIPEINTINPLIIRTRVIGYAIQAVSAISPISHVPHAQSVLLKTLLSIHPYINIPVIAIIRKQVS